MRSLSRLIVVLSFAPLAACGSFTAGVEAPDLAADAARFESQVRIGETTRPQVHALLGEPLFANESWGVELYRQEQSDVATEWMVVVLVPVPGWTEVRDYRLYPLLVYTSSGVVAGLAAGRYAEHHRGDGASKSPEGMSAEVLGFMLAVDACDEPSCLWLVAPADRSVPMLRAPPAAAACVINIAKPENGLEIALDGQGLMSSSGSTYGASDALPAEPWFARITVPSGTHTVRATPTGPALAIGGELIQTIDCRGDQLFVVRVLPEFRQSTSFFSRAQLTGEIQVLHSPDAVPDDARLILFHGDRSLAPNH
jgi:hypothetical protein